LLISAVFVQLSIIESDAPPTSAGGPASKDNSLLMVIINRNSLTITGVGPIMKSADNKSVRIKKQKKEYDYAALNKLLQELKRNDPKLDELIIMSEPSTEYEVIINVMDAARTSSDDQEMFPRAFFGGVTS
jgi:biopolymer transport protein ExbD